MNKSENLSPAHKALMASLIGKLFKVSISGYMQDEFGKDIQPKMEDSPGDVVVVLDYSKKLNYMFGNKVGFKLLNITKGKIYFAWIPFVPEKKNFLKEFYTDFSEIKLK